MTFRPQNGKILKNIFLSFTLLFAFFAFTKNKDYNTLKDVLIQDKQDLQMELDQIVTDYKQLNVKNKKLSKRVINEINKIITLKKSVEELEVENFSLLRNYRKRTTSLQKENRNLISTVDSLNIVNIYLKKQNVLAQKKLKKKEKITLSLKKENTKLAISNKSLEQLIEPAREIKTSLINATALKERNSGKLKITDRHNKTDAIKVNFKLLENNLSIPGDKKILIQVKNKENKVVAAKETIAVLKNDRTIEFSDEVTADYKNKEVDVLSLILVDRNDMKKGDHKVSVFVDGTFSSSSVVTLR